MKRLGVSAAVGFVLGREFLDDLHLLDVDDANFIFVVVRCVHLLEVGNVLDAFDSGDVRNRLYDSIVLQIDDV